MKVLQNFPRAIPDPTGKGEQKDAGQARSQVTIHSTCFASCNTHLGRGEIGEIHTVLHKGNSPTALLNRGQHRHLVVEGISKAVLSTTYLVQAWHTYFWWRQCTFSHCQCEVDDRCYQEEHGFRSDVCLHCLQERAQQALSDKHKLNLVSL